MNAPAATWSVWSSEDRARADEERQAARWAEAGRAVESAWDAVREATSQLRDRTVPSRTAIDAYDAARYALLDAYHAYFLHAETTRRLLAVRGSR